jgi:hypothetical protein
MQLKIKLANAVDKDVIVGSLCMPYDSGDLPPQEEVKRLVAHVKDGRLKLLLG